MLSKDCSTFIFRVALLGLLDPEDEVLWKISNYIPVSVVYHPRKLKSSATLPWEPLISYSQQCILNKNKMSKRKSSTSVELFFTKFIHYDQNSKHYRFPTPWNTVLLAKLLVAQVVNRFSVFYWTHKFIMLLKIKSTNK